jgi:hypothetical protein
MWCIVVKTGWGWRMEREQTGGKGMKPTNARTVRASISFPSEMHETLEGIAKEKKVSLGWVVREAAEKYIADKWPLFLK